MAATPVRILIVGKTGVGKSSLANTMFGETVFTVDHTANAATAGCRSAVKNIDGTDFKIIDSVGFFDRQRSENKLRSEMVRCFVESSPGPHAFLILLKKENFTSQEDDIIAKIQETFTEEVFNHAILVFTRGDDLQPNETIKDFVQTNQDLRGLYNKCGRRCFVVDNRYWNNNPDHPYRNNQVQATQLLNKVKHMAELNPGRHYTNPALEEVERRRQELVNNGIPWDQANTIIMNFLITAAGITTGILVGALLGVPRMVLFVINLLTKMKPEEATVVIKAASVIPLAYVVGGAVVVGATGAAYGAYRGFQEGQSADSIYEAGANTASALYDETREQFNTLADTVRGMHKN
ncbi:GTPase IMAP family member 7-like [Gouania willdenowi]|uniref:GTPase IMAP family member 7-like n=1 Tax=Gouania willdenowi TaxID=441366 RepID=UPI00105686AA|nr:GTPase IMAP family member 7-like [Gouania willdenowi]